MLLTLLLAFQLPFSLPPSIEQWKAEIEARGFDKVEIIRVPGDPFPIEDEAVLQSYFKKPDFAATFSRAQALTFRYEANNRVRNLILVNSQRLQESGNTPSALLSHELGHLWLASLGYLPPQYEAGPRACLAVFAGDIVQHILIRQESDRRGIEWRSSYRRDYAQAYKSLRQESNSQAEDPCFRAQRLCLMIDVRSGFATHAFPEREPYLNLLAGQDLQAEAIAIELIEDLDGNLDLSPASYEAAIRRAEESIDRLLSPKSLD